MRKKQTKKQADYPSTNVSSPVRATKRKIQDYAYRQREESDEDHYEQPRHPTRGQKSRSHQAESFDDEFAQVRVAKPARAAKQPRGLGKPITVDKRLAGLSELEQDALRDFVNGAKSLRQDLMTKNGHRQAIFSDTVLREMGLRLPTDLEDMKNIPGINPEMVTRYGRKFMLLVDNTREMYGFNEPVRRDCTPQRPPPVEEFSDGDYEEDNEQVYDPNHEEVIDLCGDTDEEVPPPAEDDESDYSYGGESDDDESEHRSHHFTQPLDPEVEEFNNRLTQTMAANAAAAKEKAAKRAPRASSSGPKKRGSYRKSGGSTGGKAYWSGVKKRGGSSKATSNRAPAAPKRAAGGGGGSRRSGAGGAGGTAWSGVMAMPTG